MSFPNLDAIKGISGLPDPLIDSLDHWLSSRHYNHRRYILPQYFSDDKREVSYDLARESMYWAVKAGVLSTNYEVYCPVCSSRVCVVHRQMDIPESIQCEDCGYSFNPLKFKELIQISFNIKEEA